MLNSLDEISKIKLNYKTAKAINEQLEDSYPTLLSEYKQDDIVLEKEYITQLQLYVDVLKKHFTKIRNENDISQYTNKINELKFKFLPLDSNIEEYIKGVHRMFALHPSPVENLKLFIKYVLEFPYIVKNNHSILIPYLPKEVRSCVFNKYYIYGNEITSVCHKSNDKVCKLTNCKTGNKFTLPALEREELRVKINNMYATLDDYNSITEEAINDNIFHNRLYTTLSILNSVIECKNEYS
jgi:hypothetical protein